MVLRLEAGLPADGPPPVACYGACGGVAGWKDPAFPVHCTLCQGSGKLPYYDPRKLEADAWNHVQVERRKQAARADVKRKAAKRVSLPAFEGELHGIR